MHVKDVKGDTRYIYRKPEPLEAKDTKDKEKHFIRSQPSPAGTTGPGCCGVLLCLESIDAPILFWADPRGESRAEVSNHDPETNMCVLSFHLLDLELSCRWPP